MIFDVLKGKKHTTRPLHQEATLSPGMQAQRIDGRRHLIEHPYALPKDLTEQDRLKFQHYALRHVLKGNYVAPLSDSTTRILDVGTGTGQWAYEMAREFPFAPVVGLDLEPPMLPTWEVPPNYHFVQGDLRYGLPFADHTFDLVHQRLLGAALPASSWSYSISELVRVTRPGGYIELLEVTDTFLQQGPATKQLIAWWHQAERLAGFRLSLLWHLDIFLEQAGVDARDRRYDQQRASHIGDRPAQSDNWAAPPRWEASAVPGLILLPAQKGTREPFRKPIVPFLSPHRGCESRSRK